MSTDESEPPDGSPPSSPPAAGEKAPESTPAAAFSVTVRASATAKELQSLPANVRSRLGAVNELLFILDAVVLAAEAILDEEDTRPWLERVESFFESFGPVDETISRRVGDWLVHLSEEDIERFARQFKRQNYLDYVRKMVGQAAFHRLHVALSADVDIVAAAAHFAIRSSLPFSVAISDLAETLTDEQIAELLDFNPAGGMFLEMSLSMLSAMDEVVDKYALPDQLDRVLRARDDAPTAEDLLSLTRDLRQRISGRSRERVKELSAYLDRKLQGAKDALAFSADSVSQAANSLVEFIDRLCRLAFTEDEVLDWLARNYTGTPDLLYTDTAKSVLRPTKRGQALCLLHGRADVQSESAIHVMMASSLNATRKRLQSLKHADDGSPEDMEAVTKCMAAVEAFVHLGLGLSWATLSDDALAELRLRLDPSAAAAAQTVMGETA